MKGGAMIMIRSCS